MLFLLDKHDEALQALQRASQLHPHSAIFYTLGQCFYQSGNITQAILVLQQALENKEDDNLLNFSKMEKKIADEDLRANIENEKITIKAYVLAYRLLIRCYLQLNEVQNAKTALQAFQKECQTEKDPLVLHLLDCAKKQCNKSS